MDTKLADRVALVTGASRGIGHAIARALTAEGAHVVMVARHEDELKAAAEAIGDGGGETLTVTADISTREGADAAVAAAHGWKNRLEVVVNNAGPPMQSGAIATLDDDVWSSTFGVKAMGMVRVSRAALGVMPEDGTGSIVNISGATATTIIPNAGVTGVTNAGVTAFTAYLATEAAAKSIRVNGVCPGMTDTEGWRTRLAGMGEAQGKSAEEVRAGMTAMLGIRLGRWASPDEIASAVVFLASDAASYITGEVIRVDGGLAKAVA